MKHMGIVAAATALAALALPVPAEATVFSYSVTGTPSGNDPIDFALPSPVEIATGDTIDVAVALTGPYTVGFSPTMEQVLFFDFLTDKGFDAPVSGLTAQGSMTINGQTQFSGCYNCIFNAFGSAAGSPAFSFDSLTTTIDLTELVPQGGFPVTLTGLRLSLATFSSSSPVPEPATWALLIAGIGVTGTMLRRARNAEHNRLQA